MKNKGRLARRIIAVIVCMTLVLAALPTGVFSAFAQTEKGKLKVTSISDIHYFADSEKRLSKAVKWLLKNRNLQRMERQRFPSAQRG